VSGLLSGLSSITVLIVGIVTGLFILLFLMKDWRPIVAASSNWVAALLGLPPGVGRQIVSDTVHSFRSYALGVTIIGLMNGVVIGLGAALLGATLAAPVTAVALRTIELLRGTGRLAQRTTASGRSKAPAERRWKLAGGLEPPTCCLQDSRRIVHAVLPRAVDAAHFGWVVQPARCCGAE
jgi:hypothetical protein